MQKQLQKKHTTACVVCCQSITGFTEVTFVRTIDKTDLAVGRAHYNSAVVSNISSQPELYINGK